MRSPQSGIFALGTASHAYLELRATGPEGLVSAVAGLREPRTTMGGVNLVVGFRPGLWPGDEPAGLHGFDEAVGIMPATQQDAVLWISGASYDVVFDVARAAIDELAPAAEVALETSGWSYHHDRDLTGFIDGTENPTLVEAPDFVLIPEGEPGEGGSILLLQQWAHDVEKWESLSVEQQEDVMGRRKSDSEDSTRSRATRTLRAPTRTRSATSSAATPRMAPSPTTGRCSSASATSSVRSMRCSRAWPA